jgi:hypothetical protein
MTNILIFVLFVSFVVNSSPRKTQNDHNLYHA